MGKKPQLGSNFLDLSGFQGGQIQLRHILGVGLSQNGHHIIKGKLRIGLHQSVHLLRVQGDARKGENLQVGQVLQIFQQQLIFIGTGFQGGTGGIVGNDAPTEIHGVGDLNVGVFFHIIQNGTVAVAAAQINGFQVGIGIQQVQFAGLHDPFIVFHRFFWRLRLGLGGCRSRRGGDLRSGGVGFSTASAQQHGSQKAAQTDGISKIGSHARGPPITHNYVNYNIYLWENQEIDPGIPTL